MEITEIQIEKKIKELTFADDTIVYISDPPNSTSEFPKLINFFSKVAGHKTKQNKNQ